MKRERRGLRIAAAGALALGLALPAAPCHGQRQSSSIQNLNGGQAIQRPSQVVSPDMNPALSADKNDPMRQARWRRRFNQRRHDEIVADTRKLLRLTAELKAEIDETHATTLTEAELRTVATIQKLAHNVRENMALTMGPASLFPDLQPPLSSPLQPPSLRP